MTAPKTLHDPAKSYEDDADDRRLMALPDARGVEKNAARLKLARQVRLRLDNVEPAWRHVALKIREGGEIRQTSAGRNAVIDARTPWANRPGIDAIGRLV